MNLIDRILTEEFKRNRKRSFQNQPINLEKEMENHKKKQPFEKTALALILKSCHVYLNLSTDFTSSSSFLMARLAIKTNRIEMKGTISPIPFSEFENPPGKVDKL